MFQYGWKPLELCQTTRRPVRRKLLTETIDDDLAQLRSTIREVCDEHSSELRVREVMASGDAFDLKLWSILSSQVGVAEIAVPTQYGGLGFGVRELAAVAAELGRSLACVPFFASSVMAVAALVESGDSAVCEALLPSMVTGEMIATLAVNGDCSQWTPDGVAVVAHRDNDTWSLSGELRHVIHGAAAHVVLVAARSDAGIGLFAVRTDDTGITVTSEDCLDLTRPLARIELNVASATPVGACDAGETFIAKAVDIGMSVLSAEQVGCAERVLDVAVEYAKQRHQFGRPIGSFQAIKHKCADMLIEVEKARSASASAIEAAATESADLPWIASMAKAVCSESFSACTSQSLQIHGGIGFTWECGVQLYFKRARSTEVLLGGPTYHWDRLGRAVAGSKDFA